MRFQLQCAVILVFAPLVLYAQETGLPSAPTVAAPNLSIGQQAVPQTSAPKPEESDKQPPPLVSPNIPSVSITRSDAERIALKNNPRITANQLLGLAE